MRIGHGFDSHSFAPGVPLKIGGVEIPHDSGLAGHSDGDVLLHALTDALLGAVAAGDIGGLFPPSDPRWKGADSAIFVRESLNQVQRAGYNVANVDATLIMDKPKIGPHAQQIRARMAEMLGLDISCVSVKAKTPEGLNMPGTAAAHVVVLLAARHEERELAMKTAEAMPQHVVDVAVEQTLENSEPSKKRKSRKTPSPAGFRPDRRKSGQ